MRACQFAYITSTNHFFFWRGYQSNYIVVLNSAKSSFSKILLSSNSTSFIGDASLLRSDVITWKVIANNSVGETPSVERTIYFCIEVCFLKWFEVNKVISLLFCFRNIPSNLNWSIHQVKSTLWEEMLIFLGTKHFLEKAVIQILFGPTHCKNI